MGELVSHEGLRDRGGGIGDEFFILQRVLAIYASKRMEIPSSPNTLQFRKCRI